MLYICDSESSCLLCIGWLISHLLNPEEEVISSEIYKENVDWINDCIKNGYNILDIGAIEGSLESTFYKMETESVKKAISNGTK